MPTELHLAPGALWIHAGTIGSYKTTLALNIAARTALNDRSVLFISSHEHLFYEDLPATSRQTLKFSVTFAQAIPDPKGEFLSAAAWLQDILSHRPLVVIDAYPAFSAIPAQSFKQFAVVNQLSVFILSGAPHGVDLRDSVWSGWPAYRQADLLSVGWREDQGNLFRMVKNRWGDTPEPATRILSLGARPRRPLWTSPWKSPRTWHQRILEDDDFG